MQRIYLIVILIALSGLLYGQGSGRAVQFNGTNEFIRVNHNASLNLTTTWTIECWINPDITPSGYEALVSKNVSDRPPSIWLYFNSVEIWYGTGTNGLIAYSNFGTISAGEWQHVAATRSSGGTVRVYINGELEGTFNGTSVPPTNSSRINFARRGDNSYHFDGAMDEIRYWNVERSQTEIRDAMCTKLTGSETGLVGYWRLDEATGNVAQDDAGSFNGSLRNTPTRITSGAPIGDASAYLFPGSWAGQSVSITSPEGDSMVVSSVTGSPDGMVLYRVDEVPNSTTGITNLGSNDHYYGVFKANGTAPTYTMTYHFGGNDPYEAGGVVDSDLRVFTRNDNSVTSWSTVTSTLNGVNETLTATGQNSEYILGAVGGVALPVTLVHFDGEVASETVELRWETLTEINNDYFTVEKLMDDKNWVEIGKVQGSGNSTKRNGYSLFDDNPSIGWNIYRLRQTDFNGEQEVFDPISVSFKQELTTFPSIYPNPTKNFLTVQLNDLPFGTLHMYNSIGELLLTKNLNNQLSTVETSDLVPGFYFISITSPSQEIIKYKVLKSN